MTATVLVLTVGMMGTMAYLSTVSNKKQNTFTGSKGISLELTETYWDNELPDSDSDGTKDDLDGDGMPDTVKGSEAANGYTPGTKIFKNPVLKNTTTESNAGTEWVAIAVSYQIKNVKVKNDDDTVADKTLPIPYEQMCSFIDSIDFSTTAADSGYWIPVYMSTKIETNKGVIDTSSINDTVSDENKNKSKGQAFAIFLYSKTLEQTQSTVALFNKINIKTQENLVNEATGLKVLNTYIKSVVGEDKLAQEFTADINKAAYLPQFDINVIGAAVKNEYKKDGTSDAATKTSELSSTDKSELLKNLVEVLGNNMVNKDEIFKVGASS